MNKSLSNKVLPLTLHQLLIAQQQYKRRRIACYQNTSYEFIYVIARIINISGFDFKICDSTISSLDISIIQNSIRKSTDLIKGKYYRFVFQVRKNLPYNQQNNIFGYEVIGLKRVSANQITKHIVQCIQQKINRHNYTNNLNKLHEQQLQNNNSNIINNPQLYNKQSLRFHNTSSSSLSRQQNKRQFVVIKQQIKKYCKQIRQFDEQKIFDAFKQKDITIKQVKQILNSLADDSLIMDLGLVYQWVGQQQQQQ